MDELKEAEEKILKILTVVNKGSAFDDPSLLSQLMVRLAHCNHTVGRHLAGLQGKYRLKRREVFEDLIKEHKVTRAKEEAENAAREEEELYDHYNNLHTDTQTFINVCQSHLKVLALEAKSQL